MDSATLLDPSTSPELAAELARTAMLTTDMFESRAVSTEVNKAGVDESQLAYPSDK